MDGGVVCGDRVFGFWDGVVAGGWLVLGGWVVLGGAVVAGGGIYVGDSDDSVLVVVVSSVVVLVVSVVLVAVTLVVGEVAGWLDVVGLVGLVLLWPRVRANPTAARMAAMAPTTERIKAVRLYHGSFPGWAGESSSSSSWSSRGVSSTGSSVCSGPTYGTGSDPEAASDQARAA